MSRQMDDFRRFLLDSGVKEATATRYVSAVRTVLVTLSDPTDGAQLDKYRNHMTEMSLRIFNAAWAKYGAFCGFQNVHVAQNGVDRAQYRSLLLRVVYACRNVPPAVLQTLQWRHLVLDDKLSGFSINGKWFDLHPEAKVAVAELRALLRAGNHFNMHWSIVSKTPDRDAPLGISTIFRIRQQAAPVISSPSGPFHHEWEKEVYATLIRCGFTSDNADSALESIRIYAPIEIPHNAVTTPLGTFVADFTKGTITTVKVLPSEAPPNNVIPIRTAMRVEDEDGYEETSLEQRIFPSKTKNEAPSEVFDPNTFEKIMEEKRRAHEARRKAQQEADAAAQSQSSSMSAPTSSASNTSSIEGAEEGTATASPGAVTFTLPPTITL